MAHNSSSRRAFLRRWAAGLSAAAIWPSLPKAGANPDDPSLRDLADAAGIWLNAGVSYGPLTGTVYQRTLTSNFNMLTPEGELQWRQCHTAPDIYTFDHADWMIGFAQDHAMNAHGLHLVWNNNVPQWLSQGVYTAQQVRDILRDHIHTLIGHYIDNFPGVVTVWNVVNEAFDANGNLANGFWKRAVGTNYDYVNLAFQYAAEADPDGQTILILNDFGNLGVNTKSTAIYNRVQTMRNQGIRVDGIGMQAHLQTSYAYYNSMATNMQRIADLGVYPLITELDVDLRLPVNDQELQDQADTYWGFLNACLNQPASVMLQTWGFTDRFFWNHIPGWGAPLPFDENYNPKPAYDALYSRMLG